MKRCLSSARPLRLRHGPSQIYSASSIGYCHGNHASPHSSLRWASFVARRPRGSPNTIATDSTDLNYAFLGSLVTRKFKKYSLDDKVGVEGTDAWVSLLEKHMPSPLRRAYDGGSSQHQPGGDPLPVTQKTLADAVDVVNTLYQARKYGQLDLLTYVGVRLNNWPAVDFILGRLLDAAEAMHEITLRSRSKANAPWLLGSKSSLDELSSRSVDFAPRAASASRHDAPDEPASNSLDISTARPFAEELNQRFMGEVWRALGSLVLEAADASPNEAKLAMSHVFFALARLHTSGAISDKVYEYISPSNYQSTYRPPGMYLLKSSILQILSDAAWSKYEADLADKAAAAGQESPFIPVKMNVRQLEPAVWMELILWCCVEQGYVEEAAWLIEQMRTRRSDDQRWSVKSLDWKLMLEEPSQVRKTNVELEGKQRQPHHPGPLDILIKERSIKNRPAFDGMGERTISVEVIWALLDSLPNVVYQGQGSRGLAPRKLLSIFSPLKFAVGAQKNSGLLPTNWRCNSFLVRMMESGGLNSEKDPHSLADLLQAISRLVPPYISDYAQYADEERLDELTPSDLYDQSSAAVGLIEYNLRNFASLRLCGQAMDSFAWLQDIVDASKRQRIGEFFFSPPSANALKTMDTEELLGPSLSCIPHLSTVTFAELLDLITVSRTTKFGDWLLSSNDFDGPPIPKSMYGDQSIAPSIIRFAAATKNEALADSVVGSLQPPLSVNTLRALLNYRIVQGQWDSVIMMLEYLRDHRLKSWGHSNVTTLAAEIIRLQHAVDTLQVKQEDLDTDSDTEVAHPVESLNKATSILHRLLKGEFNERERYIRANNAIPVEHRDFQARVLYGLHRLFLTIRQCRALHDVAVSATRDIQFRPTRRSLIPYIPSTAFHTILAAVVDTQGSDAGKQLFERVCLDNAPPEDRRVHHGGIPRMYLHSERFLERGDPHFDPAHFRELQRKSVIPNMNTVRIILQKALKEYATFEEDSPTNAGNNGKTIKQPEVAAKSNAAARPDPLHAQGPPPSQKVTEQQPEPEKEEGDDGEGSTVEWFLGDGPDAPQQEPKARPHKILRKDNPAFHVLAFCITRYISFGLRAGEITRETDGYVLPRRTPTWQQRSPHPGPVKRQAPGGKPRSRSW